ncbi:MAG TPA: DUF4082 domain-containing protein, partial [bacterium]|nr:DUF4082 domain-containing protein [bacterium]
MITIILFAFFLEAGTVSDDFSSLQNIAAQHQVSWDGETGSFSLGVENTETAFSLKTSTVTGTEVREYGFEFEVGKDGRITGLGRYNRLEWNLWVNLWNPVTEELILSADVPMGSGWSFASITPIPVNAGQRYRISVSCDQMQPVFADQSFPFTSGSVEVIKPYYSLVKGNFPDLADSSFRGIPDIEFKTYYEDGYIESAVYDFEKAPVDYISKSLATAALPYWCQASVYFQESA